MVWPRSPLAHDPAIDVRHSNRASGRHATAAGGDPPGAVSFSTARRSGGAVLDGRPGQVVAAAPASRGSRSPTPPGNLRATVRCLPRRRLQGHPPFAQSGCAGATWPRITRTTPTKSTDRLGRPRRWRRLLRPGPPRPRGPGVDRVHPDPYVGVRRRSCASTPATRWTAGRWRPIDFLQERQLTTRKFGGSRSKGELGGQGGHVWLGVGGRLRRGRE